MSTRAEHYADEFLRAWQSHYIPEAVATGRPDDLDLPEGWRTSVASFHGTGLAADEMLDAVAITMEREDIANVDLFRYFCGVCWHKIRAAREHPAPLVAVGGPAAGEMPKLPRTMVRRVACPACGAPAGGPCVGVRGKPRERNHAERVLAADAARAASA